MQAQVQSNADHILSFDRWFSLRTFILQIFTANDKRAELQLISHGDHLLQKGVSVHNGAGGVNDASGEANRLGRVVEKIQLFAGDRFSRS